MKLSEELTKRGFIYQSSVESVAEILDGPPRVIYHGIDPSADSAHAGNFVLWLLLRRLHLAGHKVIFLVGGGTGMIGDPKPDVERPLTPPEEVAARVEKLKAQAQRILGSDDITFVNNHDWLGEVKLIDFLRDIGKHFTVNELIKKDAIATRLSGEAGISYTEFAYPLLQAYDFLTLHRTYGCDVQIGGSDQWGNMVAGVELIRRVERTTVYAITAPLVIDKTTGKKFGKSEGNAVWLDAEKTSPYQFYQFWLNVTDENVIDYLKLFGQVSLEEINEIAREFEQNPGTRVAQKLLAKEVTTLVHGEAVTTAVMHASEALFGTISFQDLSEEELSIVMENAPQTEIVSGAMLTEVLVKSNLATSKREARTFIESGAIVINDEKQTEDSVLTQEQYGDQFLLRRGKKQLSVVLFT